MFNNIFKKFQKNQDLSNGNVQDVGQTKNGQSVRPMGQYLQRKFARGIQYNSSLQLKS